MYSGCVANEALTQADSLPVMLVVSVPCPFLHRAVPQSVKAFHTHQFTKPRLLQKISARFEAKALAVCDMETERELRVYAISDLHTHHSANRQWVHSLDSHNYKDALSIVAGDVSDSMDDLRYAALSLGSLDVGQASAACLVLW